MKINGVLFKYTEDGLLTELEKDIYFDYFPISEMKVVVLEKSYIICQTLFYDRITNQLHTDRFEQIWVLEKQQKFELSKKEHFVFKGKIINNDNEFFKIEFYNGADKKVDIETNYKIIRRLDSIRIQDEIYRIEFIKLYTEKVLIKGYNQPISENSFLNNSINFCNYPLIS